MYSDDLVEQQAEVGIVAVAAEEVERIAALYSREAVNKDARKMLKSRSEVEDGRGEACFGRC